MYRDPTGNWEIISDDPLNDPRQVTLKELLKEKPSNVNVYNGTYYNALTDPDQSYLHVNMRRAKTAH